MSWRYIRLAIPKDVVAPDSVSYCIYPGFLVASRIPKIFAEKKYPSFFAYRIRKTVYIFDFDASTCSALAFKDYPMATVCVLLQDKESGRAFYDYFYVAATRPEKPEELIDESTHAPAREKILDDEELSSLKSPAQEKPTLPDGFGLNFIKKYSKNVSAEPNWRKAVSFTVTNPEDFRIAFKFVKAKPKDYSVFVRIQSSTSHSSSYVACTRSRDDVLYYVSSSDLQRSFAKTGLDVHFSSIDSPKLYLVVLPKDKKEYVDHSDELFFEQYSLRFAAPKLKLDFSLSSMRHVDGRMVRKGLRKHMQYTVARSDLADAWLYFSIQGLTDVERAVLAPDLQFSWKSSATGDVLSLFDNENPSLFDHFDLFAEFSEVTLDVYLSRISSSGERKDLAHRSYTFTITDEPKVKVGESELAAEPEVATAPAELSPEPAVSADPYADIFAGKEDVNFSGDSEDDWFR